ncbi:hypothetical protein [Streptomyces scopuliridis]|uniref:Uncharacterized protein n=1 Tax=Streptomyces scopuliridis TaxID=452529 RepID=A0ACD4ZNQ7_9ACTN|nr:hypothetical protein [Streptomyces scopuliridis]WSC00120.1 hypothetical protein OG835_26050 [Streptomyces scopuliridis]
MAVKEVTVVPEQRDALTELVQQHVGIGKRWSTRDFSEIAVDPDSGWSPSKSLVGKIIAGNGYTITPPLVSALAVGLGLPREVVAAAAHFQVIGYAESELAGGAPAVLVHRLDASLADAPKSRAVAERWDEEG